MQVLDTVADRIEEHREYAAALAGEIRQKLPTRIEYDDLLGLANLGLVEAAVHFDETRGVNFKTFAYTRIRGAIYDGLAKMTGIPKGLTAQSRQLAEHAAQQQVMSEICQANADATPLDADVETLSRAFQLTIRQLAVACSLSSLTDGCDCGVSPLEDPAEQAARIELTGRLREAVHRLPANQAAIIRMHYFEGATLTECATALGKHKAWISRLHTRAIDTLRLCLEDGPHSASR